VTEAITLGGRLRHWSLPKCGLARSRPTAAELPGRSFGADGAGGAQVPVAVRSLALDHGSGGTCDLQNRLPRSLSRRGIGDRRSASPLDERANRLRIPISCAEHLKRGVAGQREQQIHQIIDACRNDRATVSHPLRKDAGDLGGALRARVPSKIAGADGHLGRHIISQTPTSN
jgi:hypothetical protein